MIPIVSIPALLLAAACTGGPTVDGAGEGGADAGPASTARTQFDFTITADRALFVEHDLQFRSTAGPYAIYEVTGPAPRLDGPAIAFARGDTTYSMLCGSSRSFRPDGASTRTFRLELRAGAAGDQIVQSMRQGAVAYGKCSKPRDSYGPRLPPPDPTDDGGGGSDDGGGVPIERVRVTVDGEPPIGAAVLLRRVGLTHVNPGHNDSHVIPRVCCLDPDTCGVDEPPEPDDVPIQ